MKLTQERILLAYLADIYPLWTPGFKLHGNTNYGWLGSRTERTCRDLRESGKLESKIIGKFVHYRVKKEVSPILQELHQMKVEANYARFTQSPAYIHQQKLL